MLVRLFMMKPLATPNPVTDYIPTWGGQFPQDQARYEASLNDVAHHAHVLEGGNAAVDNKHPLGGPVVH